MANKIKRIMFISNTRLNYTNILKSMLLSLQEMDFYVNEVDVMQHPGITKNPNKYQGGHGPVEIIYSRIKNQVNDFKPHIIIFAAGGLTFSEEVSRMLKQKNIMLLGITLSDPDVLCTAKNYANRFTYHTTNSKVALEQYKKLGFTNTLYLPFGIDSRFFVPSEKLPKYQCDVCIIGHYDKSRLPMAKALKKKFDTKIYGSNWPYKGVSSVAYPEWLGAVQSAKIVVDYPRTRAGYNNVKIRLFEVAAAGTLLITEYVDEISEFFEYDKEIVGYRTVDEMYDKIQYYIDHPAKRMLIAKRAQIKCAQKHMWRNRFEDLFNIIGINK